MAKRTYEEIERQSKLISELSSAVSDQAYGTMDCFRARTYWKKRLPELLEHADELAEALTYALDNAALKPSRYDWKRRS